MQNTDFKIRIIDCFNQHGLSQRQAAKNIGIAQSKMSKIVNGNQSAGNEFLIKLIEMFNLNINWLLTGKGTMYLDGKQDDNDKKSLDEHKQKVDVIEKYCKLRKDGHLTDEQLKIALDDLLET